MDETIKTIEGLIAANEGQKEGRTAFLDMALGGLRTAKENLSWHVAALAKIAAEKAKNISGEAPSANNN